MRLIWSPSKCLTTNVRFSILMQIIEIACTWPSMCIRPVYIHLLALLGNYAAVDVHGHVSGLNSRNQSHYITVWVHRRCIRTSWLSPCSCSPVILSINGSDCSTRSAWQTILSTGEPISFPRSWMKLEHCSSKQRRLFHCSVAENTLEGGNAIPQCNS